MSKQEIRYYPKEQPILNSIMKVCVLVSKVKACRLSNSLRLYYKDLFWFIGRSLENDKI